MKCGAGRHPLGDSKMRTQTNWIVCSVPNRQTFLCSGMLFLSLIGVFASAVGAPSKTIRETVKVSAGDVTDAELKKHSENSNIGSLDLSGCKFTSKGFSHLKGMQTLTELNLSESSLTSADMEVVSQLKSLRVLVLAKTVIDDAGLQTLAAHRTLESLDISFTRATKTSLESLNGLTSLKKLNIKGTAIGLTNLVVLKRLGNIEVTYLDEQFTFQETSLLRIMQADAKNAAREVDKLIGVCKSGTSDERVRAIMRLCDLTLYDDRAEHVILGVASNDLEKDQEVKRWSIYHLSHVSLDLALPVLKRALTDSNNEVAMSAVFALSSFTHGAEERAISSEVLINEALTSKNINVRKEAWLSIATSYPTPVNRRLVSTVKDDTRQPAEVREYAADILMDWDQMERKRKALDDKNRSK